MEPVEPVTTRVVVGVDIGKQADPTAIVVIEHERRGDHMHYLARHLERVTLGTSYPMVADRVADIVRGLEHRATMPFPKPSAWPVELVVDATGIGLAVVDLMRERGLRPVPVLLTAGERRTERQDGTVGMGKAWLVSRLQVVFQAGRIHLPNTDEARALATELQNYEIRVNDNANAQFGAFRHGTHDDLVTALALAVGDENRASVATDASAFGPAEQRRQRGRRPVNPRA